MKLIKSLVLVFMASAMLISCGGGSSSSPESVAENFYKAVMEFDFDKAAKYCTAESAASIKESKKMMDQIPAEQLKMIKEASKSNKMEVVGTEISEDGNTATVSLKISGIMGMGGEDTLPIKLEKENGEWKISDAAM